MDTNILFQNGATWLRADFHLHTRADKEFTYIGEENDFVNQYVNKLVEQNIRIGVITNHNKFDAGEYKAIAKKARKEGIFVLPGVELSVNDGANGVHTLVAFDPNQWLADGKDYINQFITTNFIGKHNYENENGRSNNSLNETLSQLDKLNKNFFIIMAHVEQNSGLLNEFDGGRIIDLGKDPLFRKSVIGFQKMRTNDLKNNLHVWLENKVPCFVEGSDPKSINDIGKGESCFLKIGDYNFEAVKFALIDSIDRCSKESNHNPENSYIKSIVFQGGLLDGKQIYFSPELNNLIGIRGSGKSSILEILRYALNIPLGSQDIDFEYKNDLITHVLKSGGKVVVELVNRNNETYYIERIYGQQEDIYKDGKLQQGITLDAILQRPVYFGQKDLSNKNSDFENDLVNKLIGSRLNEVKKKIDSQKQEIQRIVFALREYSNLSLMKKETETIKNNAEHKLKLFEEKGISDKLQKQTNFESDISKVNNYISGLNSYISDLTSLIMNYDYLVKTFVLSDPNKDISNVIVQQQDKLKLELDKLKSISVESQKSKDAFLLILTQLKERREALKEEFAQIKREINIPELNPDDFIKINRELEISKLKLAEIEKSEDKRKDLLRSLSTTCAELDKLWHEEFTTLQQEVYKINGRGTKLSIEINYKERKDKFLDKLQEICKGSGIRSTAYDSIVSNYADFIDIWKNDFANLTSTLNENQLVEFKKRFSTNLFELLTFQVGNRLVIKFEGKPLKDHSLGQRASALILFLLTQKDNDILIIDQPEDDLDNQTIYQDVIHEIKKLKGKMQFIFATHNANIPVLGDSEMLVACEYIDGKEIKLEKGSVDCPPIQKKIINIMEGGKEAFNIRRKIYKIWEVANL